MSDATDIWDERPDKIEIISGDETDELFSSIFISPCTKKISNDPFEDADPLEDISPCNRTSYECPREMIQVSPTTGEEIEPLELVIDFDFEIHYDEDVDLVETVNDLEGAYLQHLAALTGLLNCDSVSAEVRNKGNRKLQSLFTQAEEDALIAIKSDPADTPDPIYSECIVPVQSSITTRTNCAPIKGGITLIVEPNLPDETVDGINRGLLKTMREAMINDVYVTRDIRKVSFIGTRLEIPGAQKPPTTVDKDKNLQPSSMTGIWIGFICVGIGLLVVTVLAIGLFMRRRRNREEEREEMLRDVIFYDATVESKDLAALQPNNNNNMDNNDGADNNDGSTTRSLAGIDELDELVQQSETTNDIENLNALTNEGVVSSEIPTASGEAELVESENLNVGDDIHYSPSTEPLLPSGGTSDDPEPVIDDLDDRSDIESIDGSIEEEEDDRSDIDSIDSDSAAVPPLASNSTDSIPSVPYAPLSSESQEETTGKSNVNDDDDEPEVILDRLNIISEIDEENMVSEDSGTEEFSVGDIV